MGFIYPQYKDEYKTRLNLNVPRSYKSIHTQDILNK